MDKPLTDDEIVYSLEPGMVLVAKKDLIMEDDGTRAFTTGVAYHVEDVHPLSDPPMIYTIDDDGHRHGLPGSRIREYFDLGASHGR